MFHGTTILGVRHAGRIALGGDGQVSLGHAVMKHHAKKVRKLYQDKVLAGFAGSTADALTLFEKFEGKLEQAHGNLKKAAIGLAKDWRQDKFLRRLEAMMIIADKQNLLVISGVGDVIEPDDDVLAIGSGGGYALSAARALKRHSSNLTAQEICKNSLLVASEIYIYTNDQLEIYEL